MQNRSIERVHCISRSKDNIGGLPKRDIGCQKKDIGCQKKTLVAKKRHWLPKKILVAVVGDIKGSWILDGGCWGGDG